MFCKMFIDDIPREFSNEKYRDRLDKCLKLISNMEKKYKTRKRINKENRGRKKRIPLVVEPLQLCFKPTFKSDDIIKMIQQYI